MLRAALLSFSGSTAGAAGSGADGAPLRVKDGGRAAGEGTSSNDCRDLVPTFSLPRPALS